MFNSSFIFSFDRSKFHHHFYSEFQNSLWFTSRGRNERRIPTTPWKDHGRDNIGRMREGRGSILRSDPSPTPSRFLAAWSLRKLFEAMLSACNRHWDHVAGITFVRPTLFSNRGERARPALFATFSPIRSRFPSSCRDGQKLPKGTCPSRFLSLEQFFFFFGTIENDAWNHDDENLLEDRRVKLRMIGEGNLFSEGLKSSIESYRRIVETLYAK